MRRDPAARGASRPSRRARAGARPRGGSSSVAALELDLNAFGGPLESWGRCECEVGGAGGVDAAGWDVGDGGGRDAKDVGVGDGLGGETRGDDIADAAADAAAVAP